MKILSLPDVSTEICEKMRVQAHVKVVTLWNSDTTKPTLALVISTTGDDPLSLSVSLLMKNNKNNVCLSPRVCYSCMVMQKVNAHKK